MATELTARFSANSSGMTQGIEQLREKLNTLNTSLIETKQKVKSANDELKSLQKQQQELAAAMKDGGTKEQQAQMLELQTRAAQVTANLGQLKTTEKELQTSVSYANKQLSEQKNGLNANAQATDKLNSSLTSNKTRITELRTELSALVTKQKELSSSMIDGGTEEQRVKMQTLKEQISQTVTSIDRLRTTESKLDNDVAAAKSEFSEQTVSITSNKTRIAELRTELSALVTKQKELSSSMIDGGTEEQRVQMQTLKEQISQTVTSIDRLRTTESKLDNDVAAANEELGEQKNGLNDNVQATDKLNSSLSRIGTAVKAFAAAYGGKKLWEMLIGSNAEMEQYQTSMEVMLGDAEKAQQMIEDMRTFAAKTPLAMTDIVSTGTMLMNYGVDSDELIDTMTKLGDLAGGNAEKLNRVALAYGQMLAKGKVSGEELRQMTEAGVPLQTALAESIGVTGAEFSKMVSAGKVGIDDLNQAITELTSGNGKFSGMMERQSQTMQGLMSTLQDEISEFFRQMGEGAFGEVKDVLADILEQLNEWEQDGTLEEWAENLGGALADVFGTVKNIISFALDNSDTIIKILGAIAAHKIWSTVVNGITNIGSAVATLKSGVATLGEKFSSAGGLISLGLTAATVAITTAIDAYNSVTRVSREYREELERLDKSVSDAQASAEADAQILKNKAERYEELRTAESLTAAQENELKTLAEELQSTLGDNVSVIDDQTGAYNDLSTAVDDYCEKLLKQSRLEAETDRLKKLYQMQSEKEETLKRIGNMSGADQAAIAASMTLPDNLEGILESAKSLNIFTGWGTALGEAVAGRTLSDEEAAEIAQSIEAYKDLDDQIAAAEETVKNYTSALYDSGDAAGEAGDSTEDLSDKAGEAADSLNEAGEAAKENTLTLKSLISGYADLANVVKEYQQNGQLSIDTALQMIDNGYSAAIAIDKETGAIELNIKAYQELARAKMDAQKASIELEKQQLSETNAIIMGALAHAGADDRERLISEYTENAKRLKELTANESVYNDIYNSVYSDIDSWSSPGTSYTSKSQTTGTAAKVSAEIDSEKELYKSGYEAYKTEADKKLELIKRELEAKKELRDETIKAIDDEIEARKRLNEDNDLQKEIDAVKAQLKYSRLDDFSRDQLNKRLSDLYTEKSELNWQRQMSDRKDAANEKYELYESQAAAMQEKIKQSIDTFSAIVNAAASGTSAMTVINNNNSTKTNTANINLAGQTLTMAQITKAVKDALMDDILR